MSSSSMALGCKKFPIRRQVPQRIIVEFLYVFEPTEHFFFFANLELLSRGAERTVLRVAVFKHPQGRIFRECTRASVVTLNQVSQLVFYFEKLSRTTDRYHHIVREKRKRGTSFYSCSTLEVVASLIREKAFFPSTDLQCVISA